MVDRLLWLGAAVCWTTAFAIMAQRQRVLARRLVRLERAEAIRNGSHVTVIGPAFTPAQVAGFRRRVDG